MSWLQCCPITQSAAQRSSCRQAREGCWEVEREIKGRLKNRQMKWVREGKISASGALSWVETGRLQGRFLLLWLTPSLWCSDRQAQIPWHAQLVVSWDVSEQKPNQAKRANQGDLTVVRSRSWQLALKTTEFLWICQEEKKDTPLLLLVESNKHNMLDAGVPPPPPHPQK